MTDVFISYAREDRSRATMLARALEARGWSVWWDRNIVAGGQFDQAIEQALESAGSVVVLWSHDSIGSEWVKNEAAAATQRGVMVPILLDNVTLPLEFRRRQTADLVGWTGDVEHEGFRALCNAIAARVGRAAVVPPPPRRHPSHRAQAGAGVRRSRRPCWWWSPWRSGFSGSAPHPPRAAPTARTERSPTWRPARTTGASCRT